MIAPVQQLCHHNLEQFPESVSSLRKEFLSPGQLKALHDPKYAGTIENANEEALKLGIAASLKLAFTEAHDEKFSCALVQLSTKRQGGAHCALPSSHVGMADVEQEVHRLSHLTSDEKKDVLERLNACKKERQSHLEEIDDANELAKTLPDDVPIRQRIQEGLETRRKNELKSLDTDLRQISNPSPKSAQELFDLPDYNFLCKEDRAFEMALGLAGPVPENLPKDDTGRRTSLENAVNALKASNKGATDHGILQAMSSAANIEAAPPENANHAHPEQIVSRLLLELSRETVDTKNDGHCFFHATNLSAFSVSPTDLRASLLGLFHGPEMDDQFVKNCFGDDGKEPNNVRIADCYLRIANGIGREKCSSNAWGDTSMLPLVALKEQSPIIAVTEEGIHLALPDGKMHVFDNIHSVNEQLDGREVICCVTLVGNHWTATRPIPMPPGEGV